MCHGCPTLEEHLKKYGPDVSGNASEKHSFLYDSGKTLYTNSTYSVNSKNI